MKRILAFLLCFCLCVSLLPAGYAAEDEDEIFILDEEYLPADGEEEGLIDIVEPTTIRPADGPQYVYETGHCGKEYESYILWELRSDGELRFCGTGPMKDYFFVGHAPWFEFDDEIKITKIVIESGITSIGDYAFTGLDGVTSVSISDTVSEIGQGAVADLKSLEAFSVDSGNSSYCTVDGVLFTRDRETLVSFPGGKLDFYNWNYTVPDGTKRLEAMAFFNNEYLSYIDLPDSLESLGTSVFQGCVELRRLFLPYRVTELPRWMCKDCHMLADTSIYSVTTIAYGAFENCRSLYNVYLPDSLNTLEVCAFKGSGVNYVEIPDSVSEIPVQCFMECPWLETVVFGKNVSLVNDWVFDGCPRLSRVIFTGTAPMISQYESADPDRGAFLNASFTALYPAEDSSYRSVINKDYGGSVTWEPYTDGLYIKEDLPAMFLVYEGWTCVFDFRIGCVGSVVYQWQYKTPGGTTWYLASSDWEQDASILRIRNTPLSLNGATFRCKVTGGGTSIYTREMTLEVKRNDIRITRQPADQTASAGQTVSFSTQATGSDLNYEWQYSPDVGASPGSENWYKYDGATTPNLTIEAKSYRDGYRYRCRVYNYIGSVYTEAATLTILKAPAITAQPQSITAKEGQNVSFSVAATGGNLTYTWYYRAGSSGSWSKYSTGTSPSITLEAKAYRNGYQYFCIVSNSLGSVSSKAATLTVQPKPVITAQPQSVSAEAGKNVTFSVTATGATSYIWYYRTSSTGTWTKYSNTSSPTLTVEAKTYRSGYQYFCLVSNAAGSVSSKAATLTVTLAKPVITTQPQPKSAAVGQNVTFSVAATGGNLTYTWYYRSSSSGTWTKYSNSSTASITVEAKAYRNGYQYFCIVSNSLGSTSSRSATLTICTAPAITTQPRSLTANVNADVSFTVAATGGALTYQWYYRTSSTGAWTVYGGGTSATLIVTAKSYRNGYQYRCLVKNAAGEVYSSAATLRVG